MDPDLVVNSAAHVDADEAELDPDKSYRVNFTGTQNLALACAEAGCPLAFVSSDYVFDGTKGAPYTEFDPVSPACVYGRAKVAAESYISSVLNRYYIFRTQWLFGKHGRKNFVKSILCRALSEGRLRVVTDEVGTPTSARDLAGIMCDVTSSGRYGLYHATNSGICSRFEFAREIVSVAGLDVEVEPIRYGDLNLPCPRPPYSPLDNANLRYQALDGRRRHYRQPLSEYVYALMASDIAAPARSPV
jgi:dTDP-4-dehydrorhamnose reductase